MTSQYKKIEQNTITRELLALTGGVAPLILSQPSFKERPNFLEKASRWEWVKFKNSARSDQLELFHWKKVSSPEESYAVFNNKIDIMSYTAEEYLELLHNDQWSKSETDYLFDMCRKFDLRFFVIADRYQFIDGDNVRERSLEDIKERYYQVCQRLARSRNTTEESAFDYNKELEIQRKQHLKKLYNRTAAQAAEEEILIFELKRREQLHKRWDAERVALLRLLSVFDTSEASVRIGELTAGQAEGRKRKSFTDDRIDETPTRRRISNNGIDDSLKKEKTVGVFLQSQKLSAIKVTLQLKVISMLEDLGIPTTRPKMPTTQTMEKYDELRQSICALLELKKLVDRSEVELRSAQARAHELGTMDPESRKIKSVQASPAVTTRSSFCK